MTEVKPAVIQAERSVAVMPARFKLAEVERQDWVANCEYGTTLDDLKKPEYWAHIARKLKIYDHIEARSEDGAWIAYLIVTGVDRTWARVAIDRVLTLTTADVAQSQAASVAPRHRVEWKGPQHKYAVIRNADSQMVKAEFQDKSDALSWMRQHEQAT